MNQWGNHIKSNPFPLFNNISFKLLFVQYERKKYVDEIRDLKIVDKFCFTPGNIYLLKVNDRNTINTLPSVETPFSSVSIADFEQVCFLGLLNDFMPIN